MEGSISVDIYLLLIIWRYLRTYGPCSLAILELQTPSFMCLLMEPFFRHRSWFFGSITVYYRLLPFVTFFGVYYRVLPFYYRLLLFITSPRDRISCPFMVNQNGVEDQRRQIFQYFFRKVS